MLVLEQILLCHHTHKVWFIHFMSAVYERWLGTEIVMTCTWRYWSFLGLYGMARRMLVADTLQKCCDKPLRPVCFVADFNCHSEVLSTPKISTAHRTWLFCKRDGLQRKTGPCVHLDSVFVRQATSVLFLRYATNDVPSCRMKP